MIPPKSPPAESRAAAQRRARSARLLGASAGALAGVAAAAAIGVPPQWAVWPVAGLFAVFGSALAGTRARWIGLAGVAVLMLAAVERRHRDIAERALPDFMAEYQVKWAQYAASTPRATARPLGACLALARRPAAPLRAPDQQTLDALLWGPAELVQVNYRGLGVDRALAIAARFDAVVIGRASSEWPGTGFILCAPSDTHHSAVHLLAALAADPEVWHVEVLQLIGPAARPLAAT